MITISLFIYLFSRLLLQLLTVIFIYLSIISIFFNEVIFACICDLLLGLNEQDYRMVLQRSGFCNCVMGEAMAGIGFICLFVSGG